MSGDLLDRGNRAHGAGRWDEAYEHLTAAQHEGPLSTDDLAVLADAAWWLGHNDEAIGLQEQVYELLTAAGDDERAALQALEVGFLHFVRGDEAAGSGWLHRAQRLVADKPPTVVHGMLAYIQADEAREQGDVVTALELADDVQRLGAAHDEPTLTVLGMVMEGICHLQQAESERGRRLIDDAMLTVRAGGVTPNWVGNVYCRLMATFMELGDIARARAWTDATERWGDEFSDAVMFIGICRVHRAQLLRFEGAWRAAEERAEQACRDLAGMNIQAVAEGQYELGELRRLCDDLEGAELAFARAHELGREPQPGLALLALVQGRVAAAQRSLNAALMAVSAPLKRPPLLAAAAEVAFVAEDPDGARRAADELAAIADIHRTPVLSAMAYQAVGVALLAEGRPEAALGDLQAACRTWRRLNGLHATGRVRVLLADAYRRIGNHEDADRERAAARAVFTEIGAVLDLRLLGHPPAALPGGLSAREVEVLTLVARGASNRDVAEELFLSERTVERHLSNIFAKLDMSSRTEAAAFAHAHGLVTG